MNLCAFGFLLLFIFLFLRKILLKYYYSHSLGTQCTTIENETHGTLYDTNYMIPP
jgi:hypothetical protein